MANDERYGNLVDAELPSARTVAVARNFRRSTYFYPTSSPNLLNIVIFCQKKKKIEWYKRAGYEIYFWMPMF